MSNSILEPENDDAEFLGLDENADVRADAELLGLDENADAREAAEFLGLD